MIEPSSFIFFHPFQALIISLLGALAAREYQHKNPHIPVDMRVFIKTDISLFINNINAF
jgi:hypothetical protein